MTTGNFGEVAPQLAANEWIPIPLRGKVPLEPGWTDSTIEGTTQRAQRFGNARNTGLVLGVPGEEGLCPVGLDIDVYNPAMVKAIGAELRKHFTRFDYRVGMAPKTLVLLQTKDQALSRKLTSEAFVDEQGRVNRVELLSRGNQFVASGVHPVTGTDYAWYSSEGGTCRGPLDTRREDLPMLTLAIWMAVCETFSNLADVYGWTLKAPATQAGNGAARVTGPLTDPDAQAAYLSGVKQPQGRTIDEARTLLRVLDPDEYGFWVKVGMAIHHEFSGSKDGFDLWNEWSITSPKYKSRNDLLHRWKGFQ